MTYDLTEPQPSSAVWRLKTYGEDYEKETRWSKRE